MLPTLNAAIPPILRGIHVQLALPRIIRVCQTLSIVFALNKSDTCVQIGRTDNCKAVLVLQDVSLLRSDLIQTYKSRYRTHLGRSWTAIVFSEESRYALVTFFRWQETWPHREKWPLRFELQPKFIGNVTNI